VRIRPSAWSKATARVSVYGRAGSARPSSSARRLETQPIARVVRTRLAKSSWPTNRALLPSASAGGAGRSSGIAPSSLTHEASSWVLRSMIATRA